MIVELASAPFRMVPVIVLTPALLAVHVYVNSAVLSGQSPPAATFIAAPDTKIAGSSRYCAVIVLTAADPAVFASVAFAFSV